MFYANHIKLSFLTFLAITLSQTTKVYALAEGGENVQLGELSVIEGRYLGKRYSAINTVQYFEREFVDWNRDTLGNITGYVYNDTTEHRISLNPRIERIHTEGLYTFDGAAAADSAGLRTTINSRSFLPNSPEGGYATILSRDTLIFESLRGDSYVDVILQFDVRSSTNELWHSQQRADGVSLFSMGTGENFGIDNIEPTAAPLITFGWGVASQGLLPSDRVLDFREQGEIASQRVEIEAAPPCGNTPISEFCGYPANQFYMLPVRMPVGIPIVVYRSLQASGENGGQISIINNLYIDFAVLEQEGSFKSASNFYYKPISEIPEPSTATYMIVGLSVLIWAVANLSRTDTSDTATASLRQKRKRAAWDDDIRTAMHGINPL